MKKVPLVLLLVVLGAGLVMAQSVRIATAYKPPFLPGTHQDTVLNGLTSIRCCDVRMNAEGNGKAEIAVTDYADNGHVCIFEVVGNDSVNLVWTSPKVASGTGGGSTPRSVRFADLDGDGKIEVVFESQKNGIFIFEHDGSPGSHNYGTSPSMTITIPNMAAINGNCEYMDVADVDGDGMQELLVAWNDAVSANEGYYIFSATPGSDWSTNDPGFASIQTEYQGLRGSLAKWGLNGGTPYAMITANFGGTGAGTPKQILVHNWYLKNVTPMRSIGTDTYRLADTTNNKQNCQLAKPDDDVALFGGMAYDIDGDGRDEVYLPTYVNNTHKGWVHMISYAAGDNLAEIDSAKNVTILNMSAVVGTTFGFGYGDIDGNGKTNLYFSSTVGSDIVSAEFQGGDKRNPANWIMSKIYVGDRAMNDTSLIYRDSLGTKDTVRITDAVLISKFYARNSDVDQDGNEDIVMPYQAPVDSLRIRELTWNAVGAKWDTVKVYRIEHLSRWGFRILEKGSPDGVDVKDLVVILPNDFRLEQNYPNPFNPSTSINFFLPLRSRISLRVFDLLGREVRTLINNEEREKGTGSAVWDGKDNSGHAVSSGTYFYTLRFGNFEKTNKMMVLK